MSMSSTASRDARPSLSGEGNSPAAINRSNVRREIASRCAACSSVMRIGRSETVAVSMVSYSMKVSLRLQKIPSSQRQQIRAPTERSVDERGDSAEDRRYLRSAFEESPVQEAFYCVYLDRKNHPFARHMISRARRRPP
jgi:hypothetical protein